MKYFYYLSIILLFLLFANLTYANDSDLFNPYKKDYPFKSAIIHYSIVSEYSHGMVSKGYQTVYIKDGKIAKITKMKVPQQDGKVKDIETLKLFTPKYVFNIDLNNRKGIKVDNSKRYAIQAYEKLSKKERKEFHERMDKRDVISFDLIGLGRKVDTDTLSGRECDIYESGEKLNQDNILETLETGRGVNYMRSCIWREAKIPLKIKTENLKGSYVMVAEKIEENVEIDDGRFEVPQDVTINYDKKRSELGKRQTMARFKLYKTGEPMVVKMKLDKKKVKTNKKQDR